jgi:predicted dehydrogenase
MTTKALGVGIIGAGMISKYYMENLVQFADVRVVAIADLDPDRAAVRAAEFGVEATSVPELLGVPGIAIVLNLTTPAAHAEVSMQIMASSKHVWSEKPLAVNRREARLLLAEADRRGLRVACAPDTFLGGALQTAQRTVASGRVGEPKSALAVMQSPGPERIHPNPEFFYEEGAGPLLDAGPYYVTALAQMLGPVRRVTAVSSTALLSRTVLVGADSGAEFPVHVPTQHMALLEFAVGATATLITSFDSGVRRELLEIYGSEAALEIPNPSRFEGDSTIVALHGEPETVRTVGSTWGRGVGVLDLARSLREDVPERASGGLAYHILDVLLAVDESAATGAPVIVESTVQSPPPLPAGWDPTAATFEDRLATRGAYARSTPGPTAAPARPADLGVKEAGGH